MSLALQFLQTPARFVPAELHHDASNGWNIIYYLYNPMIDKLERKRLKLNSLRKRCSSLIEFKLQVEHIVTTINLNSRKIAEQLTEPTIPVQTEVAQPMSTPIVAPAVATKSPAEQPQNTRYNKPLSEVADTFIKDKSKELREATLRSYKSFCKTFMAWMNQYHPNCKADDVTKEIILDYMEYGQEHKDWNARTYNNCAKQGSAFFSWAVKKCYCHNNPFENFETQRVQQKERTIIPASVIQDIDEWFAKKCPQMRIIMRMVYTSLLRPIEISRVQVKQLDFKNHCIHMPGDKTKNWEARDARMDSELEMMLLDHIRGAKPDDYLFADSKWICGKVPMRNVAYSKAWIRMRNKVKVNINGSLQKLPDSYQLYSLKDTAINGMIKAGVDDLSVMQAAGHKDLKMTLVYANHTDTNLINDLNEAAPKFGSEVVKKTTPQPR